VLALLRSNRLPLAGVEENFEHFFVACGPRGPLRGCIGIELYDDAAILRSLAVAPRRRRRGLGRRLVAQAMGFASVLGVRDLYLLTTGAADYFRRFGFRAVARARVPRQVRSSAEFSEAACAGAAVLVRRLPSEDRHHIRPAVRRDLPDLVRLIDELTITASPAASRLPVDRSSYARGLAEVLADPRQRMLVAEVGGRIAGTLTVIVIPNLSHRGSPWAVVENVIVDRRYRRRGVARDLVAAAIRRARAAGCYKVGLTSNLSRREAHRFYAGLGFEAYAHGYRLEL
jgi:N-acetylglutamate synthase-like GNAT family acetyltransferase